jgi:hypothetical protein
MKQQIFDIEVNRYSEIASVITKEKWKLLVIIATFIVMAIIYLNHATYYYTATMNVTPVQTSSNSSKLGNLAGLASIAGVSLPQDSASMSFALYTEGLRSRLAADTLSRNPVIMQSVFKSEWNAQQARFVEPNAPMKPVIRAAKTILGLPQYRWRAPDSARLQVYLQKEIKIIRSPKSPVVTIIYSNPDADFAGTMLSSLNKVVDNSLRQRSLNRSNDSIAYLTRQMARVTLAEHREAVAAALSEQEKQRMFASSSMPFAAEPFDGIIMSLRPTSPQPVIVLIAAVFAGLVAGIAWIVVRAGTFAASHRAGASVDRSAGHVA